MHDLLLGFSAFGMPLVINGKDFILKFLKFLLAFEQSIKLQVGDILLISDILEVIPQLILGISQFAYIALQPLNLLIKLLFLSIPFIIILALHILEPVQAFSHNVVDLFFQRLDRLIGKHFNKLFMEGLQEFLCPFLLEAGLL